MCLGLGGKVELSVPCNSLCLPGLFGWLCLLLCCFAPVAALAWWFDLMVVLLLVGLCAWLRLGAKVGLGCARL